MTTTLKRERIGKPKILGWYVMRDNEKTTHNLSWRELI